MTIFIDYVKTNDDAVTPKPSSGNVGIDLHCIRDVNFSEEGEFVLRAGKRYLFSTGLKIAVPQGYAAILKDRSGMAAKFGIHVLAGVIDSSYTGEWKVCLVNLSEDDYTVSAGDKICQFIIIQDFANEASFKNKNFLIETDRGEKGFGSSGK